MATGMTVVQAQTLGQGIDIGYCLDPGAKIDIEEVVDCNFLPKKDLPRGKLSDATFWVRIQVDQSNLNHSLAVRIGPHFLSNIELYEKKAGVWQIQTAGSKLHFNEVHATLGGYVFQLEPSQLAQNTIYLRVQTSGLGLIMIDVAESSIQGIDSISQQLSIGIHIGALMLILGFSIFSCVMHPSALMFRFCWLTFDLLLCILAGSGVLAKYVFDQHPWLDNAFFNWMVCLRLACWVWVSQAFLQPYQTPGWYVASCKVIYLIVAISMILVSTEKIAWLQHLLLLGFITASLTQVIAIQKTPEIQRTFRNALLAGFISTNGLIFMTIVMAANPFGFAYAAVYATRVVDFVAPLVLLTIVAFRNRLMRQEFDEVKSTNMQISMRLEFERKLLKERRVLLDMLTHELKNPLASISMAVGSLTQSLSGDRKSELRRLHNMNQSVLNMDSVIERCHLMNQIDNKELSPRYEKINVSDFILHVAQQQQEHSRIKLKLDTEMVLDTDVDFLRIILTNLLENAVKYSPVDSEIAIELFKSNANASEQVCMTVSNAAKHDRIPDRAKIFERFYRDPNDWNTAGSGLGLYLVQELCKILGGTVEFVPYLNRIKFQIILPCDVSLRGRSCI